MVKRADNDPPRAQRYVDEPQSGVDPEAQPGLDPAPRSQSAFRLVEGALAAGLALAALVIAAFVGVEALWDSTPQDARAFPAIGHLAFLVFAIASTLWAIYRHTESLDPLTTTQRERQVVRSSLRQFTRAWLGVLGSWFLLYGWLAAGYYTLDGQVPSWFDGISDLFNVVSVLGWAMLGLVLDRPSTPTPEARDRHLSFRSGLFWSGIACIFALGLSVGGRALGHAYPDRFLGVGAFGSGVVGIAVSVAMAFFFSGLSHGRWLFGLSRWPLVLLWAYCALQLTWSTGVLGESPVMGLSPLALLWVALALKAYLFGYLTNWLRSGMLEQLLLRLQREVE